MEENVQIHYSTKAEQIDHIIHSMRLSGELSKLTNQQIDNIIYALQTCGHLKHLKDIREATYNDGYLISYHNADFLKDSLFEQSYELGLSTNSYQGFDIRWRVYLLCWAASHAKLLEGDFVECGVNRGGFSLSVMNYINFNNIKNKSFYLLDTFCGIPTEDHHLANLYHNAYSECYEDVKKTFSNYNNVKIIRGKVRDTLSQVNSQKICYLSIDMNYPDPEIAALNYFWDKLVSGALVILDDYGAGVWHLNQKKAFDDFAREKDVNIFTMPTCQGLLIKP